VTLDSGTMAAETRELCRYIASALSSEVPPEVAEKAKHHILDTLAAMVSGSRLPPGRLAIAYARAQGGREEALVVGSDVVTTAVNAALAGGMLAHADETDDSHAPSLTHPGCGVVPAAFAMAEREERGGEALLRAVALGYDVGTRVTMALGINELMGPVLFSSHTFGSLWGAAAAAGALAGFDADRVKHLLSYTVQQTSGITTWAQDGEHVEKAFDFGGMPARNGVAAATMVAAGFTGVSDAVTGERGFLAAFSRNPRPSVLVADLGKEFAVMQTNIKRWPVGSPAQAAVDAVLELMAAHGVAAQDVEELLIRLPEDGARTVDDREMPDINVQYLVAVTLLDGRLTFAASHDYQRMGTPPVVALRERIRLVGDPELTGTKPDRQGIVEIRTRAGERLSHRIYAVRGTADNPMERLEVEEKALDLLGLVLGDDRAQALATRIWELEGLGDVRDLRPLLRA